MSSLFMEYYIVLLIHFVKMCQKWRYTSCVVNCKFINVSYYYQYILLQMVYI